MNKTFVYEVASNDFGSLADVAGQILALSEPWKIIALKGDLGAGKTTLVKNFCEQLGFIELVSSPTFTIVNQYLHPEGRIIYHMDMYRIEKPDDAFQLGLHEYFSSGSWCFVEWPEKILSFFPEEFVSLTIEFEPVTGSRKFILDLP
jgi:tRNA threonylcarbamoyladenosine biosynthesis protein TsaE